MVFASVTYYGAFTQVTVQEKEVGPYLFAYQKHSGEYGKIAEVIGTVCEAVSRETGGLSGANITGIGIYYDDPKTVAKESLRSVGGCLLLNPKQEIVDKLTTQFRVAGLPRMLAVTSEFPFKGTLSIFLGIAKVYPKLMSYITEKQYQASPIVEIYDMEKGTILYFMSTQPLDEVFQQLIQ